MGLEFYLAVGLLPLTQPLGCFTAGWGGEKMPLYTGPLFLFSSSFFF